VTALRAVGRRGAPASGTVDRVWRVLFSCLPCVAACGRVGFDAVIPTEPGMDPALGALRCGESRTVGEPAAVPLGLGLVATSTGAIVAWSDAAPGTTLEGTRLGITADAIASSSAFSVQLPQPVGDFGLVGDGDTGYMLSAAVGSGALLVPLDAELAAGTPTRISGAITWHALAEPIATGAGLAVAWVDAGAVRFSRVSAGGAILGPSFSKPAGSAVSVRRAARRHIAAWTDPGGGCAVWALDEEFEPVVADPVVHLPAGACLHPAITRHDVGTNLLAWVDAGDAHAQLGTDTDLVGAQLAIGSNADDVDVAVAPGGFFVAASSRDTLRAGHVRPDATGWTAFAAIPRVRGSPIRLVAQPPGALVASIDDTAGTPQVQLTRLCEPL